MRIIGIDVGYVRNERTYFSVYHTDTKTFIGEEAIFYRDWSNFRAHVLSIVSAYDAKMVLMSQTSVDSVNIEALQAEGLPLRGL